MHDDDDDDDDGDADKDEDDDHDLDLDVVMTRVLVMILTDSLHSGQSWKQEGSGGGLAQFDKYSGWKTC